MKYPITIAKKFINSFANKEETKKVIPFDFNCRIINIIKVLSPNSEINIKKKASNIEGLKLMS